MNKIIILVIGLFLLNSTVVNAYGELQNNQYQTVSYDWFKGFAQMFSIIAPSSGCIETYKATSTGGASPQSSFPMTINCNSYGAYTSNYYCRIYTITYGTGYNNRIYHTTYAKIDGGQSATMGWYGDPGQVYQQYIVDYYDWNCPTVCTPNWQTGAWGTCQTNNLQTRTVTDSNNCGTITNKPINTQSCSYTPVCTQIYNCGSWSVCQSNNQMTRTCTVDNCGKTNTETGNCVYVPPQPQCQNIQAQAPCASDETKTVTQIAYTDSLGCLHPEVFSCSKTQQPTVIWFEYLGKCVSATQGSVSGITIYNTQQECLSSFSKTPDYTQYIIPATILSAILIFIYFIFRKK